MDDVTDLSCDMVYLPGGRPGSDKLAECNTLLDYLKSHVGAGKVVAAMCAAPMVLARAGLLKGRSFTCHPSARDQMGGLEPKISSIEMDFPILTAQGAGVTMNFALEIIRHYSSSQSMQEIARSMCCLPHDLLS